MGTVVKSIAVCIGISGTLLSSTLRAADDTAETIEALPTVPLPAPASAPVELERVTVTDEVPAPAGSSGLDGAAHTQPLSLVSLSRQELLDRGARDLTQALETVASVNAPVPFQLQPQAAYDIRGFGATVLLDGFSSLGLYGDRDSLVGVERIDFIKGPGSALNSGALGLPPGGIIDIHSIWPGEQARIALGGSRARYDQREWQIEADSGELLPVLSLGLAAQRGDGDGFFDFSQLDHRKIRPSMSLRALGARLSVYYEKSRRITRDHPGLPTTGTLDRSSFSIPNDRSINDPDVPLSRTSLRALGADLEMPLASWLTLNAAARDSTSTANQVSQYTPSNTPDLDPTGLVAPSTFLRLAGSYESRTKERQARLRLTARHDADAFGRFTAWAGYSGENAPDFVELRLGLATPLDLENPTYARYLGALIPLSSADSHFRIRNLSGGLQWRYREWLNLFGALTSTDGEVSSRQADLGRDTERVDRYDLRAQQFGASVRLWDSFSTVEDDGLWLFYGEGEGHQFRAYFSGSETPRPELSDQREGGLRLVNHDWGRLEAAAFRIQRRNVPTLDPDSASPFRQVTTGLQSVRGADLEASLHVPYPWIDRFSLNASAAWLKSRIEEDNNFEVGNRLPDVPQRNWRAQLAADVMRGPVPLRVFVTQRCRSEVAGDLANSFTVPGRCLSDTGATTSWKGLTLDVVLSNLGDKRFYEPYTYLTNAVIPGERRTARLSLGYTFDGID